MWRSVLKQTLCSSGSPGLGRFSSCSHWYITSLWPWCLCIVRSWGYSFFCNSLYSIQFIVSQETLSELFSVATPVIDPVIVRWVYKNCPVIVSQKVTLADLLELEMIDLNVILGMDWLHSCYAFVDCRTRIVRFQFQDEPILELKGSSLTPMGRFISYLKARKMISKDYLYHLVWDKDCSL